MLFLLSETRNPVRSSGSIRDPAKSGLEPDWVEEKIGEEKTRCKSATYWLLFFFYFTKIISFWFKIKINLMTRWKPKSNWLSENYERTRSLKLTLRCMFFSERNSTTFFYRFSTKPNWCTNHCHTACFLVSFEGFASPCTSLGDTFKYCNWKCIHV
jgi:hypothetical protein